MPKEWPRLRKSLSNLVRSDYPLLWFRNRYGLSPNDPRFLSITRREIVLDFLAQQEWEKFQAEIREKAEEESLPLCRECGHKGEPIHGRYCPKCGTEMEMGDVWVDSEFDEQLKRLGLTREDIG